MPGYANLEMVESLSAWFMRNDRPVTAWSNAVAIHSMLLGLRGFWPLSSSNESGNAYDLSGQGRILTYNGNPAYGLSGLAPYLAFDGTGDYLSRADEAGLDIVGNETTFEAAYRGLTLGGWFYITSLAPGHDYGLISKWTVAGNLRSYMLYWSDANNCAYMAVSTDGTAVVSAQGAALAVDTWYHIVGRFDPSASVDVWVNGVKASTVAGVPATLYSGAADLNIGAYDAGATGLLHGRASLCWLCGAALPDVVVGALYQHSRWMY